MLINEFKYTVYQIIKYYLKCQYQNVEKEPKVILIMRDFCSIFEQTSKCDFEPK